MGKVRKLRLWIRSFNVNGIECFGFKTVVKFKHKDENGNTVLDESGKPAYFEHQVDLKFKADENRNDNMIIKKVIKSNGYLYSDDVDKPEYFESYYSKKKDKDVYPCVWISNVINFEPAALEDYVSPYSQIRNQEEISDDEFEEFDSNDLMPWDK